MHLYDAAYLNMLHQRFATVKQRSYALLAAGPGQTVVDVGCGLGHDAAALAAAGATVLGLDPNDALLADARRLHGHQVTFCTGTAQATALPPASVDAVRFERVLQHLSDHDAVLAEAYRVVRPGGRLQIVDTDWLSMSLFLPDTVLERKLIDSISARYSPGAALVRQLPAAFARHGFQLVTVEVCNVLTEHFETADSVVHQFAAAEIAAGHFTAAEQAAWQAWKEAGRCWLSQNFLLFQAIKS